MKGLFFLLTLISFLNANSCTITDSDFQQNDASVFIIQILVLVTLMISLSYMYGKFKPDPRFELWAKDEVGNLVISIFLFVLIIAFFQGTCDFVKNLGNPPFGKPPVEVAINHLNFLIKTNGLSVLRELTFGSLNNQFQGTWYFFFGLTPFSGSGVALKANQRALSAHKEMVIDLYLPILASLMAQRYILETSNWIGLSLMLPFAFIMRLFPLTRDYGNILISIFLVVYIIAPTLYALSAQVFEKIISSPKNCINCDVYNFYVYSLDEGSGYGGGANSNATWENSKSFRLGSIIPQAVFVPNLIIVISITAIMSFSKTLKSLTL
jgi:hypothetical protein